MAFENLSERLQNAIKMFRGSGKITEDDLKAPLREVRMALLEADVNFKVVKDFVANIKERALGETVQQSPVSYTHLRAHETRHDLVCRLLLEKKKKQRDKA